MPDENDCKKRERSIVRRQVLMQSAIAGGALAGLAGVGSGSRRSSSEGTSVETLLQNDVVQSIGDAVSDLRIDPKTARVTAENRHGVGKTVQLPGRPGTLYVTELPDKTVVAVFRFPNDVPRRDLNVDETVPEGAKAMLVGSPDGAYILRSSSPEERRQILNVVGGSDSDDLQITTTSRSETFEVFEMDFAEGRITQTVLQPRDGASAAMSVDEPGTFEIIGESTYTTESDPTATVTTQSCDCDELVANIALCIHSLSGCQTALGCAPFGGPKAIVACAIATGCIFSILSEMFHSDAPGCVNLGQDLWNLCASECVY